MKRAFTMIELVFAIVVIGILAATIIPRSQTNTVAERAIDLLAQIRYTQHLAIVNDKYAINGTWFKSRWQISFTDNTYSILFNDGTNDVFAKNPQNSVAEIDSIELKGLNTPTFSGGCASKTILAFDYLGRPMVGSLSATTTSYTASVSGSIVDGQLLESLCTITLTDGNKIAYIDIVPETGYAKIRE